MSVKKLRTFLPCQRAREKNSLTHFLPITADTFSFARAPNIYCVRAWSSGASRLTCKDLKMCLFVGLCGVFNPAPPGQYGKGRKINHDAIPLTLFYKNA